jgi:hypothetical protein
MKSVYDEKSHLSATTTMPHYPGRDEFFDEPKERVITDAVLSAGCAAIVALCLVMAVGLYCWSPSRAHLSAGRRHRTGDRGSNTLVRMSGMTEMQPVE